MVVHEEDRYAAALREISDCPAALRSGDDVDLKASQFDN